MKSSVLWAALILSVFLFGYTFIETGSVTYENPSAGGIPQEEIDCMEACISQYCILGDIECAEPYTPGCMTECGAVQPTNLDEGEQCVQDCILVGCESWDAECQNGKIAACDVECDMAGDAPDWDTLSEEEQCITVCVAEVDPTLICGVGSEGETGGATCQQCANECAYLYDGPCLIEEEIEAKEAECNAKGEFWDGDMVMGIDPAQPERGECIVDVECFNFESEFGDDAGTGPGIGQEGYVEEVFSGVVEFFKELFD